MPNSFSLKSHLPAIILYDVYRSIIYNTKTEERFFLMFDIWGMGHPYDINVWAKHNEDSFIFMM